MREYALCIAVALVVSLAVLGIIGALLAVFG